MMYASKSSSQMCVLRFGMLPWINLYSVCLHSLTAFQKNTSVSWTSLLRINLLKGWKPWPLSCSHWNKPVHPTHSWAMNECREVPTENKNLESFLYMWCHCAPVQPRHNGRSGKQELMEISRCRFLLCCLVKSRAVKVFSLVYRLSLRSKVSA